MKQNHFTKLLALLAITATGIPLSAATICVNATGAGNCQKTIAGAIAAAAAGDTINIAAGTYKESVKIGKALSLVGLDPSKTIIDATGLSTGINVDGMNNANLSNVVISGLTVENAQLEGILVTTATNVTITGNILTGNNKGLAFAANAPPACPAAPAFETEEGFDCGEAIHLIGVNHSTVSNNTVTGNAGGILLSDETAATHDNLISGNNVSNNASDCGITLASHLPADGSMTPLGVYSNTIVGNTASQNGLKGEGAGVGIFGADPGAKAYGNIVVNNVLTGNGIPGISVHGHTPNQNLDGNVFIGNKISGNGADTDDSFTPRPTGINFYSFSPVKGTVISQNTIDTEGIGIVWNAPGDATIQRNSFTSGLIFGIYNMGTGTVNGEGNWWGCASGPGGPGSFFGGCSTTFGTVTVNSWSTTQQPNLPPAPAAPAGTGN